MFRSILAMMQSLGAASVYMSKALGRKARRRALKVNPMETNIKALAPVSALFHRLQHEDFETSVTLDYKPKSDKELAGITLYQSETFNYVFGITKKDLTYLLRFLHCLMSRYPLKQLPLNPHEAPFPQLASMMTPAEIEAVFHRIPPTEPSGDDSAQAQGQEWRVSQLREVLHTSQALWASGYGFTELTLVAEKLQHAGGLDLRDERTSAALGSCNTWPLAAYTPPSELGPCP